MMIQDAIAISKQSLTLILCLPLTQPCCIVFVPLSLNFSSEELYILVSAVIKYLVLGISI
ncbi:hypothetical protein BMF77_01244 [Dolichospermum sp. UHCC 0315A]|nr:hypothetical protein BMF77_01244 [Dolichospermum sp. UHCC 0315A]